MASSPRADFAFSPKRHHGPLCKSDINALLQQLPGAMQREAPLAFNSEKQMVPMGKQLQHFESLMDRAMAETEKKRETVTSTPPRPAKPSVGTPPRHISTDAVQPFAAANEDEPITHAAVARTRTKSSRKSQSPAAQERPRTPLSFFKRPSSARSIQRPSTPGTQSRGSSDRVEAFVAPPADAVEEVQPADTVSISSTPAASSRTQTPSRPQTPSSTVSPRQVRVVSVSSPDAHSQTPATSTQPPLASIPVMQAALPASLAWDVASSPSASAQGQTPRHSRLAEVKTADVSFSHQRPQSTVRRVEVKAVDAVGSSESQAQPAKNSLTPCRGSGQSFRCYGDAGIVNLSDNDDEEDDDSSGRASQAPSSIEFTSDDRGLGSFSINEDSTELQRLAASGDMSAMLASLQLGANVNEVDSNGRTALMYAVQLSQWNSMRVLLGQKCNVNAQADDGATTLHRAAYNGTKEVVAYLLTNGASCDVIDADGRTPLHWAIHNVDHGALSALLKHAKSEIINLQDNDGMTALMTAAHLQQHKHISKLLQAGADVLPQDPCGRRAVHWAVSPKATKSLSLLLTAFNTGMMDAQGKTVMHYAAEKNAKKAIKMIHASRADSLSDTDKKGRTPLHYAAVCGSADAIRTLLKLGAPSTPLDAAGKTALEYAHSASQSNCVALLTSYTVNISAIANAHAASAVEKAAQLTASGQKDDAVAKVFELLGTGTYLHKFSSSGKGGCNQRYFWMDVNSSEICWCKSPQEFFRSPSSVAADMVLQVTPCARSEIQSRIDFEKDGKHRYAFTVRTKSRVLDLVAPSEPLYRLWVDGLRCFLVYGELLLAEESNQ